MERVNKETKLAIQWYTSLHPSLSWFDWLPEVLTGLCIIAARAHGLTPFFVVYMKGTLILARLVAVDMIFSHSWDSICEDEQKYMEELITMFVGQKPKVAEKLRQAGEK